MSDLAIFVVGLFVTLLVGGAVGLLLWGASNESRQASVRPHVSRNKKGDRALQQRPQVIPVS